MRVLPCKGLCGGPAIASKATGELMTAGQMPGPSITYVCARCSQPTTLQAYEFHSLPLLPTPSDAR